MLRDGHDRDILIGGAGSDHLYAGKPGSILIGGSTDFDSNVLALGALVNERGRTDVDFQTCVGDLDGSLSGGLNGNYFLTTNTVHDDETQDFLYGAPGNSLDWFFANQGGLDFVKRLHHDDLITLV